MIDFYFYYKYTNQKLLLLFYIIDIVLHRLWFRHETSAKSVLPIATRRLSICFTDMVREIVGRALVNGVPHTYIRMTNPSRFCAICPGVIVIATYHASTFPARRSWRSNHDSARNTQQDTRGNVDEQNQECPVGVSVSGIPVPVPIVA